MKDVIIIGGGPAALSAGIYLGRYKRDCLLITDQFGGQAATAGLVENYPGVKSIDGASLIEIMKEQLKDAGVSIKEGEPVIKIEKIESGFNVSTNSLSEQGRAVIIASGKNPRKLNLEGENELVGKGLSYCATCDGPFAKDKEVIIIGGANAAAKSALILTKIAKKVTMININDQLSSEAVSLEKIKNDSKIDVINNAKTKKLKIENGMLSGIYYEDIKTKEEKFIGGKMVFVEIGQTPNTQNFSGIVDLDERGEIIINDENETSVTGIFAAGDVTKIKEKQIVIAAGEGAKASIIVNSYLEKNK